MTTHAPQLPLFRADGDTFEPEHDAPRLGKQMRRVMAVMADGRWHTLGELHALTGGSEAGVSARVRDLRKARYGSQVIERRRCGAPADGLFEYRWVR